MIAPPVDWDRRFLELAWLISSWSKDPSTKVGCVVVGPSREVRATGYNGLPRGVADTHERLNERELKYRLIVHAEENALLQGARTGVQLFGCTLYCTHSPCTRCAVSIIQAGVERVVHTLGEFTMAARWRDDTAMAIDLLTEVGVTVKAMSYVGP